MNKVLKSAIYTDLLFLEHDTGEFHPESPKRLEFIYNKIQKKSYYNKLIHLPQRIASKEEIQLVHEKSYINKLETFCNSNQKFLDADTTISHKSFLAASVAVGAGLQAADQILNGEINKALLLLRPPGHHSLKDKAMGFCLLNNIAITAKYFISKGIQRIAIVDWDVHHGNGTESFFYNSKKVFFSSLHQYPFYPGTGDENDIGEGEGVGYNLNIPMSRFSGDNDYLNAFEKILIPKLENFNPEIILISAGFDAHREDPLAQINLETSSFEWMTQKIIEVMDNQNSKGIISFLEGGYNLQALADSVEVHAASLLL